MIKVSRVLNLPDVWIHQNFLDKNLYENIKIYFENFRQTCINNFEGRVINYNNSNFRLIDTREHRRYHNLWTLNYHPDYWMQTNYTIFDWYKKKEKEFIPHIARHLIYSINKVNPFVGYHGNWIPIRGIYNLLEPNVPLDPHIDGNIYITNGETYSATYYIDAEGEGGEFWDSRGFYYKPKNNSLLINIGSNSVHGVRPSSRFRSGITIRFVKEKDLILPGSIDKLLYKPVI